MTDLHLLHLVTKDLLAELAESLKGCLLLLELLLLVFGVVEIEALLGAVLKLVAIEVLQLLGDVLVDGVNHVDDLQVPLFQGLNEG